MAKKTEKLCDRLEVTIYDGKYTVIQREDGSIVLLRYGQDWPECTADNVHLALAFEVDDLRKKLKEYEAILNTPEIEDFDKAVPLEAAHQVTRWGTHHDVGKAHEDWFWLVGYLAGKILRAAITGDLEKAKHHCISTSAALRNWHSHLRTGQTLMRPGIEPPKSE